MFWLLSAALAQEPTDWWVRLPVQSVQIVSPGGGAPEESLDPLLRVRQGEPLDPGKVRLDLATLFHAGAFAAVEAEVEPWFELDEYGEPQPAVILRYVVAPAPRVGVVRVQGASAWRDARVVEAAGISLGAVFYPEVDGPMAADRVTRAYAEGGFVGTNVEVDAWHTGRVGRDGSERLEVWLRVVEGEPRTLDRLVFTGDLAVSERRLRRVARRAGLAEGDPITEAVLRGAQYAMRSDLAAPDGLWGLRRGGYVDARVTPAMDVTDEGREVRVFVESGPRLRLEVDGLWPSPRSKAREMLALDERTRLTRGFVDSAPERLVAGLQRKGFLDASAVVALEERDGERVLRATVRRGARHHLMPVIGRALRVDFDGNAALPDADLRLVMQQASEEVLRYGWFTPEELDKGLEAARQRYRASGYPDARLVFEGSSERRRLSWGSLPGARAAGRAFGVAPPVDLTVRVSVDEGPLVRLAGLEWTGVAPEAELTALASRRDAMIGAPFSPQGLAELSQALIVAHREAGYLEADARISQRKEADGSVSASITVSPGPRVLLRSLVVTGTVRTREAFLLREVDLPLGEPLTGSDIEGLRRDLYELGVFRAVETSLLGDGAARDLLVEVAERPRYSFELGAGLSTDQGVRGYGRGTRHNLFGLGHTVELFGLMGLDYRSDSLEDWSLDLADPQWRAAVTYTAPHFPGRSQKLVVDLVLREQDQERLWRMATSALGVALEASLGPRDTVRAGVRTDTRRLLDVDPGALLPGEPWFTLLDDGELVTPSTWREQHALTALWLHDRRDDPLQPTRGAVLSVTGELAPGLALGVWDGMLPPSAFAKGEVRAAAYWPLGATTLHLAGEGGRAVALGEGTLAMEDRYRLGGTGSFRGFRRDGVGPRNEVGAVDLAWPDALAPIVGEALARDPTRWVGTGGDAMVSATAEWLVPWPMLGLPAYQGYAAALWIEAGNVWLLDSTATSELPQYEGVFNPALRVAFGVGARVETPVGPLQVDLAANPAAWTANPANPARQALLRDDWDESRYRVHLSLGTLF